MSQSQRGGLSNDGRDGDRHGSLRVLFVDDERQVLDGVRIALRKYARRWHMAFALSAEEAIPLLEAQRFDVVVSDMRMPGRSGATLLKLVKERWPATRRIILSGHAGDEDVEAARQVAHEYLHKPCPPNVLAHAISQGGTSQL
jgi:DNA-binding NarL/FixJ family response regulator